MPGFLVFFCFSDVTNMLFTHFRIHFLLLKQTFYTNITKEIKILM